MFLPRREIVRFHQEVWEDTFCLAEFRDLNSRYPENHLQPEPSVNSEKLIYLKAGVSLVHGGRW